MPATFEIIGNLTRDPELRFTPSGKAVCAFTVAVNESSRTVERPASFFDCEAWENLGQNIAASMKKGDRIAVSGKITQDRWTNDEGQSRSKVKMVVFEASASLRWATAVVTKTVKDGASSAAEAAEVVDADELFVQS